MGSLILCHSKRAKRPYEISRVHMRIYTIEELCYYLCNNLYLIDYTIMNRRLCDWLEDELGLAKMAEDLRRGSECDIRRVRTYNIERICDLCTIRDCEDSESFGTAEKPKRCRTCEV